MLDAPDSSDSGKNGSDTRRIPVALTLKRTFREAPPVPLGLRLTFVIAIIYAAGTALATIGTVVALFAGQIVSVAVPVAQFWPKLYPSAHIVEGPTAKVAGGGFSLAQLSVSGLDPDTRLWYGAGDLLQGATFVIIAVAVAVLCSRLFGKQPFEARLTRTFSATAAVIIIGGLGWQICFGVAGGLASQQLFSVTEWTLKGTQLRNDNLSDIGWPGVGANWSVDFWPVWVGLALFAIAACFRYGEKLQRDRTALEHDRARLMRETDGLV
jgi:hypothetical protein